MPRLVKTALVLALLAIYALNMAAMAQTNTSASTTPTFVASQPHADSYQLSGETLRHAIAITRVRHILALVEIAWGLITAWFFLALGFAAKIERFCQQLFYVRFFQGALYYVLFILVMGALDLPLALYSHHVEQHFGISVQKWSSWFGDMGISLALQLTVGVLLLLLFNWIVRKSPRRYWLWSWLVIAPLIVGGTVISPYYEQLYDKVEPLELHHAALATRLESLVARTGTEIPRNRMYIALMSEKTTGLNAYVAGLGATKRMVIWDTTAARLPEDEILFIMGHESGHYVLHHLPKQIIIDIFIVLLAVWLTAKLGEWFHARYAVKWKLGEYSSRSGFTVLLLSLSIVGQFLSPAMNAVSRHFEHEADVYGQEAIHTLVADPQQTTVRAFNDLGAAWLEDPDPNAFFEFWFENHPSTAERAKFAAHYDPWANGGKGEFFDK